MPLQTAVARATRNGQRPGRAPSAGAADDGVPRPRLGQTRTRPGSWGQPVNWGLTSPAWQRLKLRRMSFGAVPLDFANST
jgi:hypothetical protein